VRLLTESVKEMDLETICVVPSDIVMWWNLYRDTNKSLAQPGKKQARKHVRDVCDFNNVETRAVIKFFFLQGKALKEIHAILTRNIGLFPSSSG